MKDGKLLGKLLGLLGGRYSARATPDNARRMHVFISFFSVF